VITEKEFLEDVFEWDTTNWSTAARFWENHLNVRLAGASALEIGAHNGGLSLWLAMKGADVICSDMRDTRLQARKKHDHYGVAGNISYEKIDARYITYENRFDIVAFKSLLGGVRGYFGDDTHIQVIDGILRSLKPGGQLLFAENLDGCGLHRFSRARFVRWGKMWRYIRLSDVRLMFNGFAKIDFMTCGFAGAFGRGEPQRYILGFLDQHVFDRIVPESWHYILIGVATKSR